MSDDFIKVPTTREVWAVIRASHGEQLQVCSSFSDPLGTFNGGTGETGRMETGYGLRGTDYPLLWAVTVWRIEPGSTKRHAQEDLFWLCIARKESE